MKTIMQKLSKVLRKDKDYYYGWQSNIAMAFMDEYYKDKKKHLNKSDIHKISNNAAKNFLDLLKTF